MLDLCINQRWFFVLCGQCRGNNLTSQTKLTATAVANEAELSEI